MYIHLITSSPPESFPPIWNECLKIWNTSPYNVVVWNNETIDNELEYDDKNFLDTLNTLPIEYKENYTKYLALEVYGGAVFDLNIEIKKPFFNMLSKDKIYILEGKNGDFLDNSIIISKHNRTDKNIWGDAKTFIKNNILDNFNDCKKVNNLNKFVGSRAISSFFLSHFQLYNFNLRNYEKLSYEHFSNPYNEISFAIKHKQNS